MVENSNENDRKEVLRLITIGICLLELLIVICTFFYQQDKEIRTEIPISEEMARVYIDHPEKLKENEQMGINPYSPDKKGYILINYQIIHNTFPWKGWILLSIGVPVTIAFLIVLLAKAYFQVAESDRQESEEIENKLVNGLNTLSKINTTWFMLVLIGVLFSFWYIPDILKYAGHATMAWLNQYWWIPIIFFVLLFLILAFWFFLQYRLKLKAMQMNMEIEKLKYLQFDNSTQNIAKIENDNNSVGLIE